MFLVHENERYWCEWVLRSKLKPEHLAIGEGCSLSLFNADRERMERFAKER